MTKKFFFKYFLLTFFYFNAFPTFAHFLPEDPQWSDSFDHFSEKPVVALWRGIHFLKEHFPKEENRKKYWERPDIEAPVYASAAHTTTRIPYGAQPNERQQVLLFNAAASLQRQIRGLEQKGPITLNRTNFETHRYAFQHVYSNDYTLFHRMLQNNAPVQYQTLTSSLEISANPFVSCSASLPHSSRYGFGLKYYGERATILEPNYDLTGKPKNPFLGMLYGIVLEEDMLKETLPFSVPAHHEAGHIKVSTHFTCNILTEAEVSLVGRIPPKAVVLKYPLTVPSFVGDYDGDYREQYGLTKRRYNNIKSILTDAQTKPAERKAKAIDMVEKIIASPKKDQAGVYKHTLSVKLSSALEEKLEEVDAEIKEVGLEGTFDEN